jgi:hypothetical protein
MKTLLTALLVAAEFALSGCPQKPQQPKTLAEHSAPVAVGAPAPAAPRQSS